jgi:hypothetical protein
VIDMSHLQLHAGLMVPAVVLALEEVVEEAFLQRHAIVGVVLDPMGAAVQLKPFLLGASAEKTLHVAAQVQAVPAPVARGQQRNGDSG